MPFFHCQDCEHYKNSLDLDRRRKCEASGRRVWPGEDADECPHLVVETANGRIAC
jgi:hypothetical protein